MKSSLKYFILFSLCVYSVSTLAQKEGNVWTFSDRSSVNFNDTSNILVDTSADGYFAGGLPALENSTLADADGNLFCYATGVNLGNTALFMYDRTHHLMPNGSNLQGNGIFVSLLLPYPGIDSLIYLFH